MTLVLDLSRHTNLLRAVARREPVSHFSTLDLYALVEGGYITYEQGLGRYRATLAGKQLLQRLDDQNTSRLVF